MTPDQAIAFTLLNTTAISALVSTRVYYGLRPTTDELPSINFYDIAHGRINGIDNPIFSINCRGVTARAARDLGTLVLITLAGTQGQGGYGTVINGVNELDLYRVSLMNDYGLIPEPEDNCYNCPIDVRVISEI
jgi:hypothetical protein